MKRRRLLQLAALLFTLGTADAALAQTGPVGRFLQGGVVDPAASNIYVQPPRGGMVIVYRGSKPVGWLTRAGYLSLPPNRVYGLVATRGSTMLFNTRIRLGSGLTSFVWAPGQNVPQTSFQPTWMGRNRGRQPVGRSRGTTRRRPSTTSRRRPARTGRQGTPRSSTSAAPKAPARKAAAADWPSVRRKVRVKRHIRRVRPASGVSITKRRP